MLGIQRISLVSVSRFSWRNGGVQPGRFLTKTTAPPPPPPKTATGGILSFPKDHPFAFQLMVATGKTAAADLMVQTVAEGKSLKEVDWTRNAIFIIFGFTYLGGFQWYLMVHKYRQWFPTMDKFAKMSFAEKWHYRAGILDAGKMVLFDIFIHLPLMYYPTFYAVKEFVGGYSWNPVDWVRDGVIKYSKVMLNIKLQSVDSILSFQSLLFCFL
jgi:hypothetical protein